MESIQSLSVRTLFSQEGLQKFITSLEAKVLGAALVAFALLGLCYFLYSRYLNNKASIEVMVDGHYKKVSVDDLPSQISKWTFTKKEIQAVLDAYQKVKSDKDEKLKVACVTYFQRAVTAPGEHIVNIYKAVKKHPELREGLIKGGVNAWKADQDRVWVEMNFKAIIGDILSDEDAYGAFMATFLENTVPHDKAINALHCKFIAPLSLIEVKIVTRCLLKCAKNPLEILKYMIKSGLFAAVPYEKEKLGEIFRLSLRESSLGVELQELLDLSTDNSHFLLTLSMDELKQLILQWNTTLNEEQLVAKIEFLFKTRGYSEGIVEFCLAYGINLDPYLKKPKKAELQKDFFSAYVMHVLQSDEPESVKREKIGVALSSFTPASAYPDTERGFFFGKDLAKKCPPNHWPLLLTELANGDPVMGQGFFLEIFFNSKALKKKLFEAYWTCWRKFETATDFQDRLSFWIPHNFKTKEDLAVAYEAIPSTSPDRKDIIDLLKKNAYFKYLEIS